METTTKWQKQSKTTRKEKEALRKREIEVLYGCDFDTVREVFKFAFCVDEYSASSLDVYEVSADTITRQEFRKAHNRWLRRALRAKHQQIAWVADPSCEEDNTVLS